MILESQALLWHVGAGLRETKANSLLSPEDRGVEFFKRIRRARFLTSSPEKKPELMQLGLKASDVEPYKVADCVRSLAASDNDKWGWVHEHYKVLCDYVHANLSSQTVSRGNGRLGNKAQLGLGGIITPHEALIGRHEYPSARAWGLASREATEKALKSLEGTILAINQIPTTLYTEEELLKNTGSALGFPQVKMTVTPNDLCPCGSGNKFKKCHGTRR